MSSEKVNTDFQNFVYDLMVSKGFEKSILEYINSLEEKEYISFLDEFYIKETDDNILKLCIPSEASVFISCKSKTICEYMVSNTCLKSDSDLHKINIFIEENEQKKRIQWKVNFAKDWLEMFKQESDEEENEVEDEDIEENKYQEENEVEDEDIEENKDDDKDQDEDEDIEKNKDDDQEEDEDIEENKDQDEDEDIEENKDDDEDEDIEENKDDDDDDDDDDDEDIEENKDTLNKRKNLKGLIQK
jgi:hypothetical protein